jgi:hypothetical protein
MNGHLSWCDVERCAEPGDPDPFMAHLSAPFIGTKRGSDAHSLYVQLCSTRSRRIGFLFRFDGPSCGEHFVSVTQMSELLDIFTVILGHLEPQDFAPEDLDAQVRGEWRLWDRNEEARRHPRWCSRFRCTANRPAAMWQEHNSRVYPGTYDVDTGVALTTVVHRRPARRHTYLQLEFSLGWCGGHEIPVHQAVEFVEQVPALVALLYPDPSVVVPVDRAAVRARRVLGR